MEIQVVGPNAARTTYSRSCPSRSQSHWKTGPSTGPKPEAGPWVVFFGGLCVAGTGCFLPQVFRKVQLPTVSGL